MNKEIKNGYKTPQRIATTVDAYRAPIVWKRLREAGFELTTAQEYTPGTVVFFCHTTEVKTFHNVLRPALAEALAAHRKKQRASRKKR